MSAPDRLVKMANDIGAYFRAEPDHAAAVAGIATHIRRFWEPRMRRRLHAHAAAGGEGLDALVREAIAVLAREDPAALS
ncbi:MAG TPA: formate dehydrogenase subunit delta [Dokdonella sp.]|nr:formate dehydrogenase subunit delta [Dokdonella sp.]